MNKYIIINKTFQVTLLLLQFVKVSSPSNPKLVYTAKDIVDIVVFGDYAYFYQWNFYQRTHKTLLVNLSTPANPKIVVSCDTIGPAWGVTVSGDYAYVNDGGTLTICDVSSPYNPKRIGHLDTPGRVWDISVVGNYAYIADGDGFYPKKPKGGLAVVDVSSPDNPTLVWQYNTTGYAQYVDVAKDYVYLSGDGGLYVFRIEAPLTQPTKTIPQSRKDAEKEKTIPENKSKTPKAQVIKKTPAFEAILAVFGLLALAFLRKRIK